MAASLRRMRRLYREWERSLGRKIAASLGAKPFEDADYGTAEAVPPGN